MTYIAQCRGEGCKTHLGMGKYIQSRKALDRFIDDVN